MRCAKGEHRSGNEKLRGIILIPLRYFKILRQQKRKAKTNQARWKWLHLHNYVDHWNCLKPALCLKTNIQANSNYTTSCS